jgi:hypothetical protein
MNKYMEKLNILWTSSDKETFKNMISMYSINSLKRGDWDAVNVVIWGGSTKLTSEDADVQKEIKKMIDNGVTIEACKACADKYKAAQTIKDLGVDVKYMTIMTGYIKGDDKLITI